jgi:GNAT superfamily N-acetyltransferase
MVDTVNKRQAEATAEGIDSEEQSAVASPLSAGSQTSNLKPQTSNLRLRDAVASDKGPILEFCHQTWDWGDYIEVVWDEWFNDPRGGLRVGTVGGKPVGVNKLTMLTPQEGWMEGMRLHPDYRGRGYAYQFMADMAQLAEAKGAAVVRLATASSNVPIQKVAMRLGLRKVAAFTPYNVEGLSLAALQAEGEVELSEAVRGRLGQFYILESADAAAVWQHIERSPLRAVARLYANGWAWSELTNAKLLKHLRGQQVVVRLGNVPGPARRPYLPLLTEAEAGYPQTRDASVAVEAINSLAVISGVDDESGLEVGYVDYTAQPDGSDDDELEALALALRLSASSLSPARVSLMLPNEATLELAFERVGFTCDLEEGFTMFVFEKKIKD